MRTIIFGDIHGCDAPFSALLSAIAPDSEADRLILLGDMMDRGPDSWEVWQRVMALRRCFGDRLVLLRGNHESYWLCRRPPMRLKMLHIRVGRKATEESFRKHRAGVGEFLDWLQKDRLLSFYRGENFQCVHAGILIDPVEANDEDTLIYHHDIVLQNRYQGPLTVTGHIALEQASWFAGDGETVVPMLPGQAYPLPETGVLCIDTGCGKGGRLTAMVIEGGSFTLFEAPEAAK